MVKIIEISNDSVIRFIDKDYEGHVFQIDDNCDL